MEKTLREKAKKQTRQITEQARIPKPKTQLTYFYSETCPHCRAIEDSLYNFVESHPEVELLKIDATTLTGTNLLEAYLKGKREVPTVVVNDKLVVTGDRNFLARLTYAVKLAETTPHSKEETIGWLLRR